MGNIFETERVAFAGDWHGNTGWALRAINLIHDEGIQVIYHLGDFGFWPRQDGASYLRKLNNKLREHDMYIIVTPGNHENYTNINNWPLNGYDFQVRQNVADRIWVAPRGKMWTHNGVKFGSLGGAMSIDKERRVEGVSWWREESITMNDIDTFVGNLQGDLDIMLTHEVPSGIDIGKKYFQAPLHLEIESNEQRMLLGIAMDAARPKFLLHGHWHRKIDTEYVDKNYRTRVLGLDCDGFNHNVILGTLEPWGGILTDMEYLDVWSER